MKIADIDQNLAVKEIDSENGIIFYDTRHKPFTLYGLYDPQSTVPFRRMPEKVAKATSNGVEHLNYQTAGGRVRFVTDSDRIVIRAEMQRISRFSHMPATGYAGFDLYRDFESGEESRYIKTFVPPYNLESGYTSEHRFKEKKLRTLTINFPPYSGVTNLFIGLPEGATVRAASPYRREKPILFYGSSITQGACASRPGNTYAASISRRLDSDYINLGFSGSGKAEVAIADYMASLDISAFISDYDHNADNPAYLEKTHYRLYEIIRKSHPDIPYIMISRPDFDADYDQSILRRNIIFDSYRRARENGDKNVYYIDGAAVFRGPYLSVSTVDGTHPGDCGMALMANAIEAELRRAFTQNEL